MSTRRFLMRAPADQGGEEREVPEDQVKKWRDLGAVVVREVQQPRERTWVDTAVDLIPAAGATVGGVLGGAAGLPTFGIGAAPGALIGASSLAAGGESLRQLINHYRGVDAPATAADAATQIAKEGVMGGVGEGVGRYVVAPVLEAAGRGLYRSVLKPPIAVRQDFGGDAVTNTLIQAGVPISRSGAGEAKTLELLRNAGRDTANTIAEAEAAGVPPIPMRAVVGSLYRTRAKVAERAVRTPALSQIRDFSNMVLSDNPALVSPTRAQAMKQAEQELAINAYKAEMRGAPVTLEPSMHEDLARGLRQAIERRIPSTASKNQRTQDLIGALKAITSAEGRIANRDFIGMGDVLSLASGLGATAATGNPYGLAVGVLQEVLTRPEIASRLGIALDRSGQMARSKFTPSILRVIGEAVDQLTSDVSAQSSSMASQPPMASRQAMPPGLGTLPEGQKVVFHEGPFAGQAWGMVNGQPVRVQ